MHIYNAKESDKNDIVSHLSRNFIEFDPLANYLSLSHSDFTDYLCPYLNASIENELAIIARNIHGDFIGAIVSHDYNMNVKCQTKSVNLSNYSELFCVLNHETHIKTENKISGINMGEILCAGFMAINSDYYGENLPSIMEDYLLRIAKSKGYKCIIAEFTNPCNYSQHKRKYGEYMKVINRVRYSDFQNSNGIYPMKNAYGECILTIMNIDQMMTCNTGSRSVL